MQPVPAQRIVSAPSELSENMRPSRSCPALLLSLMLLAGLVGCGQTSSDNAPTLGSRVSTSRSAAPDMGHGEKTLIPSISSDSQVRSSLEKVTVPAKENVGQEDRLVLKPESAPNVDTGNRDNVPVLGIPNSIAAELDSPDALVRLQAMNHWKAQGAKAPLDPLFVALDDEDERVRAKANEIIEQYYAIEQAQARTE